MRHNFQQFTAGTAPTTPHSAIAAPSYPFPDDFDLSLLPELTPEQEEYLSDYLLALRAHTLRTTWLLLTCQPPGAPHFARSVGVNACMLAKLLHLDADLAAAPWRDLDKLLRVHRSTLCEMRTALLHRLRRLAPRSITAVQRIQAATAQHARNKKPRGAARPQ